MFTYGDGGIQACSLKERQRMAYQDEYLKF